MTTPTAQTPELANRRRGRRQLLVLAGLFFVPVVIAFYLYYGGSGWRPTGGTNKGDLINPAVPLPQVALAKPDGVRIPPDLLQGKWTVAYLGDGACDTRCRKALYLSRQSRIALNKDMDRVQRVFFATGAQKIDAAFMASEHPDLVLVALGNDPDSQTLLGKFPALGGVPAATAGRLYVIDPLGNLMLSYSAAAPDKALFTDIKKLLRLSHIG